MFLIKMSDITELPHDYYIIYKISKQIKPVDKMLNKDSTYSIYLYNRIDYFDGNNNDYKVFPEHLEIFYVDT